MSNENATSDSHSYMFSPQDDCMCTMTFPNGKPLKICVVCGLPYEQCIKRKAGMLTKGMSVPKSWNREVALHDMLRDEQLVSKALRGRLAFWGRVVEYSVMVAIAVPTLYMIYQSIR